MRKFFFALASVSLLLLGSCDRTNDIVLPEEQDLLVNTTVGDIIPGQYVVLLKEGATAVKAAKLSYPDAQLMMVNEVKKVLGESDIPARELLQVYTAGTEGFAAKLSDNEAKALEKNPGVLGVWPDKVIILAKPAPARSEERRVGKECR